MFTKNYYGAKKMTFPRSIPFDATPTSFVVVPFGGKDVG
jgi:hypothetical protein